MLGGRSLRTNLHTRQKWKVRRYGDGKIAPELDVKKQKKFTVVIERDEDGYYLASVPGLRGCHTQAKTLDTLMKRVREAI